MEAYSLVNLRKGMQSSSEQPLVGEERYVTTLITAPKETRNLLAWVSTKNLENSQEKITTKNSFINAMQ